MPKTVVRHEGEHLYANQPQTESGQRLSAVVLRMRQAERLQAERAVRRSELSAVDLAALRYLVQGHRDGRDLSPKDVIIMLATSSATVTNVLERLVNRGYLARVQHPKDRRAHYLVPTELGIRHVDDAYHARDAAVVSVIDGLTDVEADAAAAVLRRIADALEAIAPIESD
ncbi:MarR family winged helix-turn-helix transcriptional regulator [Agromyces seonyuensis]|uniref:Winged helix DNA-binding protein n=1 Tax=Agromyces seonyuensis TaxID=2662446 RepID=A0A6I4NW77_9MICO|nr:MarR family transcriptional regulator [Agromyces seonyuensis]MWB98533.1 winged helix DNA-binding protein [Agromyces seonyuensis]